ncbi:MAG: hypothetical protein ACQESV_00745 [Thermodesulfobacteriota bacterium]
MAEKKKSQQYTCVADSLAEETLKEAADSFFGQRRNIEEALQSYRAKIERLQDIQQEVALSLANLHYLLRQGKPETVRGFYTLIGVDPDEVPSALTTRSPELSHLSLPWALRDKTRYSGLLKQAYAAVVDTAGAYMHGRHYNDPENPRCKRVTVNYEQVKQMCAALTAQIEQANQYNSPSQVLQFSKKLDTDQTEKESLAGIPLQYNLDEEMAFVPPDFSCERLEAYPDFPALQEVAGNIKSYAAQLYGQAPQEIRAILRAVRQAQSSAN